MIGCTDRGLVERGTIRRYGSPRWRVTPLALTRYGMPSICVKHADAVDVDRRVGTCQQANLVNECFAQAGE
jgi:hypothetical protein